MLNRLISPFKKVSFNSEVPPTNKKNEKEIKESEYLSIAFTNPETNDKSIMYLMPKSIIDQNKKVYHPQDWNIKMFSIGRPLGRGTYGRVYLAREKKSKHIVALKVLSIKELLNGNLIGQIRREIEIHTHLDHPNILKMLGFFFDQKKLYYIMEYAPGGELYKELTKNVRFSEKRAARYVKQITNALIYIHKCNVVHRDIKPENVLLCADDQVKISDFGWSVRALTTQRKTMCGTLDYICPEIICGKFYDYSVDIWTVGVLAYELTTGIAPFIHQDRKKQSANIVNVSISYPNYLSPEIVDFISKLLQKNPADRMRLEQALEHPWILNNTCEN